MYEINFNSTLFPCTSLINFVNKILTFNKCYNITTHFRTRATRQSIIYIIYLYTPLRVLTAKMKRIYKIVKNIFIPSFLIHVIFVLSNLQKLIKTKIHRNIPFIHFPLHETYPGNPPNLSSKQITHYRHSSIYF